MLVVVQMTIKCQLFRCVRGTSCPTMYTLVLNHSTQLVYTSTEFSWLGPESTSDCGLKELWVPPASQCLRLCRHDIAHGKKHQS
jgi:hypothetical protein